MATVTTEGAAGPEAAAAPVDPGATADQADQAVLVGRDEMAAADREAIVAPVAPVDPEAAAVPAVPGEMAAQAVPVDPEAAAVPVVPGEMAAQAVPVDPEAAAVPVDPGEMAAQAVPVDPEAAAAPVVPGETAALVDRGVDAASAGRGVTRPRIRGLSSAWSRFAGCPK